MEVGGVPLYPSLPYEVVQKSSAVHVIKKNDVEDTIHLVGRSR